MSQVYLITGANSGLGLDSVRRLAMMPSTKKIYMGCRSEPKYVAATDLLKRSGVDTDNLCYVHFDCSAPKESIYEIVKSIGDDERITGLLLNAGGIGDQKSKKAIGPNHVLNVHQINLIGHIQLVEALRNKMAKGCRIVFAGSEAARGVPMLGLGNPKMGSTMEWYQDQLEGNFKGKFDPMAVYGKTKAFAALYFAEWARQNPKYLVFVVSPGGTAGTSVVSADAVPGYMKAMMPVMMPVMKAMGVMHPLEDGTERYIQAITGQYDKTFPSGTFVASKRGTTGKVVDQTTLKNGKKYGDLQKQKAAFEALSAYTAAPLSLTKELPTTSSTSVVEPYSIMEVEA